jgi:hypothetical protein
MACCRPSQTQIARDGVKGIIISTREVNGAPETVLIDKNTSYVVAKYNTLRGALHGHAYFCDAVARSYVIKDAWDDEITLVPRDEKFPELENNIQKPPKPPRL